MQIETRLQAFLSLPRQLFRLGTLRFASISIRTSKAWQNRISLQRPVMAAPRNRHGVLKRLRKIGEQLHHLLTGFEAMIRRQLTAIRLDKNTTFGNRDQGIMRFIIIRIREISLVGRNNWNIQIIGKVQERRLNIFLAFHIVALQFHIKTVAKCGLQNL